MSFNAIALCPDSQIDFQPALLIPSATRNRCQATRGLSRTPLDDHHPIDSIKDIDLFERTCGHNLQQALKSHQDTPCSSGRSSPTIKETQSPMSVSQGGWTTGNTTERSSLDSSYSLADFDKQAANTVSQHFEEFEAALYEGQSPSYITPRPGSSVHGIPPSLHGGASFIDGAGGSTSPQSDLARECREWSAQFPHLRVLGKQACPIRDPGFYHVPSSDHSGSRPTSSSLLLEVSDHDLSMSSDSQGLSLTGHAVSPARAPKEAVIASERESSSSAYSFLVEEVIAEDGLYEDIIAVDYKNIYEDNLEHKQQITPRRRRVGFPPITPNACVKDSVTSGAFDHIWQEIMSWMRQLLKRYTSEITDSKHDDVTSYSPHLPTQSTPISRDLSFIRQHGGVSLLLKFYSDRDAGDSPGLGGPARPGSSLQPGSQPRPMSHLRASGGHARAAARGGRLAPLAKNLNT
ncbi:protein fam149b1-like, partial [Plakobranchus ocellatus]